MLECRRVKVQCCLRSSFQYNFHAFHALLAASKRNGLPASRTLRAIVLFSRGMSCSVRRVVDDFFLHLCFALPLLKAHSYTSEVGILHVPRIIVGVWDF